MKSFYDPPTAGADDGPAPHGDFRRWRLPEGVLDRHDACELRPDTVPTADGWPVPASTAYRKHTLLLPGDLHEDRALDAINKVLHRVGMRLVSPSPVPGTEAGSPLAAMPRTAVLVPVSSGGQAAPRTSADAWAALTALRSAAGSSAAGSSGEPELDPADVGRISLEHLLAGAAIVTGDPAVYSNAIGEPAVYSNAIFESYLFGKEGARTPLEIALDAPARQPAGRATERYGRRPVVAVLDSGVREHPWLGVSAAGDGTYTVAPDGFIRVDQGIQDIIYAHEKQAAEAGDHGRQLIRDPWDRPVTLDRLVGEVAPYLGHGTFVGGIVRQIVPDAAVLAIRVMHNDGIVYEGDLLCALGLLAARVARAQEEKDPGLMVDAVSLSLGYFIESAADRAYTAALRQVLGVLQDMGVVVTAAAGNYATSREFYPAAFAGQPHGPGSVPVIGVGALNPNGTRAVFSDEGRWVTAWAPGAAVVSTFPVDVNGSIQPDILLRGDRRESLDPDDYHSGFAAWSGTSFAAPTAAAEIVRAMLEPLQADPPDSGLRLDVWGTRAAVDRVTLALRRLRRTP